MAYYIDRDKLIKRRHGCNRDCSKCDFAEDGDSWCEGELFIVDVLRQPVRLVLRGKWLDCNGNHVPLDDCGCPKTSCWCSVCGDWLTASDEYSTRGRFCPNCGVDMRETKHEPVE